MEYTKLKTINEYVSKNVNPAKMPDTLFEMYSVPIYETGHPEYLLGSEIASNKAVVQKNDILLCKINPRINRVWVVTDESENPNIASSELIVVRSSEYNPEFLAWYFRSPRFKGLMVSEVTGIGGSLTRAQPKAVAEYPVPVLARSQQDAIASVLNNVNVIIQKRQQQLQKLDELVKARFVEMFGDQDLNPFGWEKKTIGECCTLKSGTSLPAEIENEGGIVPYVKVGDMNHPGNERYITTSSRFVSEETAGKGLFDIGSIIFPKRGGAIGTNKKRMTKLPICADLNVMGVSSNGELTSEYLFTYFDLIDMGKLADGSSVPQINNKNISPLKICVPPLEKQVQFSECAKQIDKSRIPIQKALDEAQLLFDSLMQTYFDE